MAHDPQSDRDAEPDTLHPLSGPGDDADFTEDDEAAMDSVWDRIGYSEHDAPDADED